MEHQLHTKEAMGIEDGRRAEYAEAGSHILLLSEYAMPRQSPNDGLPQSQSQPDQQSVRGSLWRPYYEDPSSDERYPCLKYLSIKKMLMRL
jgi:hypothetical protein